MDSFTSLKTALSYKIVNVLLRERLVVDSEFVHLPLEKSCVFMFADSRVGVPVLGEKSISSSLCFEPTIHEDRRYTRVCVVCSDNVMPLVCCNDRG